ncbi:hypothetical protein EJ04DRAFT_482169 [Polyplosphaeria fusca]|uniref:Pentatricopeptide repeat-containing protein n=1 Tax=Polyplosphaeria fusca TaxID=682080 RepID=A0A9P4RCC3_9PLEO|nr:hypothetical protein EJ04DRAFT_482169 [Polyplosphaeria fusca]
MNVHVCRQCRHRLLQRIPRPSGYWQPRATFISLRTERPASRPDANARAHEPSGADSEEHNAGASSPASTIENTEHPIQASRPGRYSKYAENAPRTEPVEQRLDPPGEVMGDWNISSMIEPRKPYRKRFGKSASDVGTIHSFLTARQLDAAWSLFDETFTAKDCKALVDPAYNDLPFLSGGKIFTDMIHLTTAAFGKGFPGPSPTVALFKFERLGVSVHVHWRNTISRLTNQLLYHQLNAEQERAERILSELLSVWKLLFQCKGRSADEEILTQINENWSTLQVAENQPHADRNRDIPTRLFHHHPKLAADPLLGFSATYIFTLLADKNPDGLKFSDALRQQNMPFYHMMAGLLFGADYRAVLKAATNPKNARFAELPERFRHSVEARIRAAPSEAAAHIAPELADPSLSEADAAIAREQFFLKRIERAISRDSRNTLDEIWQQVVRAYTHSNPKLGVAIPHYIYNLFIEGYMATYKSDRALEVWNHMVAHGIVPHIKTWTAMLNGCHRARDVQGLQGTWVRMRRAGILPDNHAWTTYIHSLISLNRVPDAFAAMDAMGNAWLAAEQAVEDPRSGSARTKNSPVKQRANKYEKPSIEVINGAITALSGLRSIKNLKNKAEQVQKILQWAGNFDLKADATTYNTLVKLYLSGGDHQTTFRILSQMESEGIQPDVATYTMLLRAAFDNEQFSHLSSSDQSTTLINLLNRLESGGLKLNVHMYSSIIDRLLKQYANYEAVRAVVDHMIARKMTPTSYIYVSLLTDYFQQDPPNIAAVDTLWDQMMGHPWLRDMDKYLYDRVIEGYAKADEVGKATAVLTTMSKLGKPPGWHALTALVRALVRAEEWERARAIVRDVQHGVGVASASITGGRDGVNEFKGMAWHLGLTVLKDPSEPGVVEGTVEGEADGLGMPEGQRVQLGSTG